MSRIPNRFFVIAALPLLALESGLLFIETILPISALNPISQAKEFWVIAARLREI
jgi:hypothetical protein